MKESQMSVRPELAEAVQNLQDELYLEFGFDYAYCILGSGTIVAANSSHYGNVTPKVREVEVIPTETKPRKRVMLHKRKKGKR